jgi:hypothetical protein
MEGWQKGKKKRSRDGRSAEKKGRDGKTYLTLKEIPERRRLRCLAAIEAGVEWALMSLCTICGRGEEVDVGALKEGTSLAPVIWIKWRVAATESDEHSEREDRGVACMQGVVRVSRGRSSTVAKIQDIWNQHCGRVR